MKYRIFTLLGLLALSAGAMMQAQDYDDIYYDAAKSSTAAAKPAKSSKTVAVYGEVPDNYKVAAKSNYRIERDEDEYNRRGAFEPTYEVDINGDTILVGDTIYEEAFANTRRIERFYNPDIVILSDDDDLVELYYDESPTVNLIIGSDWGLGSYYGYGWADSYYPWYTGWYPYYGYYSWYRWYDPWYSPYYWGYSSPYWHWGWHYSPWYHTGWGWGWNSFPVHHHWADWSVAPGGNWAHRHGFDRPASVNMAGSRNSFATNRNGRSRVGATTTNRNGIASRDGGNRTTTSRASGTIGSRNGSTVGSRNSGNMGSRRSSGVTTRSSNTVTTRSASSGSRSSGGGIYGGSRSSSSGSYSGGSRSSSSGSYSGGSRSSSSGSYSSGSSHSGSSGGGGGHSGSSGGSGSRRH